MSEQRSRRNSRNRSSAYAVQSSAAESNEITIDLVELMYHLLSKWKLIVVLAIIGALIMGGYSIYIATPMYQSTSTIYVISRSDSVLNLSDLQIGTALTNDYLKVFQIWEVHEEVISNLNLPYNYTQMQGMLSVNNTSNTRMIDITIKSAYPQEAATIANEYAKVASNYIAETMLTDKPTIMSVALVPSNPVSPKKTRNIALGFLLGVLIAVAIETVRFVMDDKYKTAEDIRKYTGLTTLAIIPLENDPKAPKAGLKHKIGRKKE